ncbi:sulfite exporter TauE/SafE family protein [Segetibacter sp. 3557_3]|uniref:sulfite exporter TauE/SafE family protein n=1 Tax=Segetibacter sp. 3557_3 TaxID=2547429 RepID=UPI001058D4D9|nr:sulfite exporter TauE/SafE family protein [Segetibacter sp. 3557_3]TDH28561.1 sulfite exporter TauE/SafE family protein [Segetibacter sp. 3557_3]
MEAAGYIASLFIGVTLGLIGGGGSILTVPVLVYLFAISPTIAISYSLFIVGLTSLIGAFNNYRKGLVNFRTVLLFGSSSITTVFIARKFIIPFLPDVFFTIGHFKVTHSLFVMVVFAMLMLAASGSMISSRNIEPGERMNAKPARLVAYGFMIGLVTGFLGAGGGFLLIPALVLLMKLPIKEAIGTSLLIIALNSLIGFVGDIGRHPIDWMFIMLISAIAIAGIFIGGYFNQRVNSEKLKKGFGWFVLVMGIYIIIRETILN